MGGNSTLQSAVLSDNGGTQKKFDLKSWQGLTELLKAGKNALKPEVYAEFRNLVLEYAQHGGDAEYKKRIDDVVATFSNPVAVPPKTIPTESIKDIAPEPKPALHSRRVAPRFGGASTTPPSRTVDVGSVTPLSILPQESVLAEIPQAPQPVKEPEVTKPAQSVSVPVSEPVAIVPESVVPPDAPPVLVSLPPTLETVVEPTPLVPEPVSTEISQPPKQVIQSESEQPQETKDSFMSMEEYKERVAEIKRAVNTHFGNPVALMAVPNNLGKIYMTALLAALKASSPGSPVSVDSAILELELAYNQLIEGNKASSSAVPRNTEQVPPSTAVPTLVPEAVTPEIVSEPKTTPELVSTPVPLESVAETLATLVPPTEPVPLTESEIGISLPEKSLSPILNTHLENDPERMSILERIESEQGLPSLQEHTEASRSEEMHSAFEKTDSTISAVVGSVHKTLNPLPDTISGFVTDGISDYEKWAATAESASPITLTTLESEDPIAIRENKMTKKNIVEKNDTETLVHEGINTDDVVIKQTELFSSQITKTLDKMLHDWNVFAGSGFFGIGPGGIEHPLFKRLGVLSMGEVLAGRFDEADPKIVKAIKQYVDAWHHEQGIIFTQNETFEHYLRRVVQKISKRQGG
ncbi:hypothetical protein IPH92_00750 [Candidatus Kaiserbacteria bacterium]|nr:MAG: hypothetical protein IPH92_00750 [Candidatus Kaiserbacteria bacterium]